MVCRLPWFAIYYGKRQRIVNGYGTSNGKPLYIENSKPIVQKPW